MNLDRKFENSSKKVLYQFFFNIQLPNRNIVWDGQKVGALKKISLNIMPLSMKGSHLKQERYNLNFKNKLN